MYKVDILLHLRLFVYINQFLLELRGCVSQIFTSFEGFLRTELSQNSPDL